ncbi:hypothetical protein [Microbacterium sp. B19]|uniref:hypothetical protein n=1 Tax=Microbacterium sp. B19 TaxID=96765 RepID=UPI00034C9D1E|nr:hypothetical protein [Microbacterium sp. B19]
MRKTVRRIVAWGIGIGLAAVFGVAGAAGAADAPPASGDGAVWMVPPAASVGQQVQIIGLGFTPNADVYVTTSASPDPTLIGRSASDGTFTLPFTVPDLPPGQHQLDATAGSVQGGLEFMVLAPGEEPPSSENASVQVTPNPVTPGQRVVVSAEAFPPDVAAGLRVMSDPVEYQSLGTTNDSGRILAPWTVPDLRPGTYRVFVYAGNTVALTELTVAEAAEEPEPAPSSTEGSSPGPQASASSSPTFTPTAAPQLAASGTPDVGGVVPWGVAALVAAAAVGVHRLRSRAKG